MFYVSRKFHCNRFVVFQTKCEQYWPNLTEEAKYGRVNVMTYDEVSFAGIVQRKFRLTSNEVKFIEKQNELSFIFWRLCMNMNINLFNENLATVCSTTGPILSCHVFVCISDFVFHDFYFSILYFWWRQLTAGRDLKFPTLRDNCDERFCPRCATAIHTVDMDRTPYPMARLTKGRSSTKLSPPTISVPLHLKLLLHFQHTVFNVFPGADS